MELPILAYLSCVEVFIALGDVAMAQDVIENGINEIKNRLAMIGDKEWKKIFLEAIPENHGLLAYQKEDLLTER